MSGNIIIYGSSSLISLELIKILDKDTSKFYLFCRNKNEIEKFIINNNFDKNKFIIFEVDLIDLKKNLELINNIKNVTGLIWMAGFSGDSDKELEDLESAKANIQINLLNPILIINEILKKIIKDGRSFLVIVTSVAGLRGRGKNLIYGSAKSGLITYASGLRQKFNKNLKVITVIPGYIKTKNFNIIAPSFLICTPAQLAIKIFKAIKHNKEIIYSSFIWKIIMVVLKFIPEKIFKKLKF